MNHMRSHPTTVQYTRIRSYTYRWMPFSVGVLLIDRFYFSFFSVWFFGSFFNRTDLFSEQTRCEYMLACILIITNLIRKICCLERAPNIWMEAYIQTHDDTNNKTNAKNQQQQNDRQQDIKLGGKRGRKQKTTKIFTRWHEQEKKWNTEPNNANKCVRVSVMYQV